jgi:histidinol-phosphatase
VTAGPPTPWDDDLQLAWKLADAADTITAARFLAGDLRVESKPDLTPVTDADQAVEQALRTAIEAARPADAILGEEYGVTGDSPRRWVIDPIDGTKNFVRGVPVWATLIALQHEDQGVVGLASAPALQRRWWAVAGGGAWTSYAGGDPRPCHVSQVRNLSDASLSHSSLGGWKDRDLLPQFLELLATVWRSRAFGDFWSHVLVAEGAVDAACEPELSVWDTAALQVIVTEAGGRFTDLSGVARADGGNLLSSNGLLHDEILGWIGTTAAGAADQPAG